ncbi:MAG: hydantoinase/oxoprolinase family protein, partial [Planctomycetota bacterium]
KGERRIYEPEEQAPRFVSVYDGHKTRYGHRMAGPAVIEQVNTTLLLTAGYDCICDPYGSFVVYRRGREDRLSPQLREKIS